MPMTGCFVTSSTRWPRKYTTRPSRKLSLYCSTVRNAILCPLPGPWEWPQIRYKIHCYSDHFLREQVDGVRPEPNLLASGNNRRQCEDDYFRRGNNYPAFKPYC